MIESLIRLKGKSRGSNWSAAQTIFQIGTWTLVESKKQRGLSIWDLYVRSFVATLNY